MIDIVDTLQIQILKADTLLRKVQAIPAGRQSGSVYGFVLYDAQSVRPVANEVNTWLAETLEILRTVYGEDSRQQADFQRKYRDQDQYTDFKEDVQTDLDHCKSYLEALFSVELRKQGAAEEEKEPQQQKIKAPKVFISHKKEDKAYADALVNMIERIVGSDGDKIFCSSVQGYGIRQSRDIMDKLKAQFDEYEIFMIIIHSPRYYQSAVCLNEMGAAWVMGSQFSSFLTTDCRAEHLRGVINNEKIFIDPNDDPDMLEAHLNDFKNDLLAFFGKDPIDENKWANARKRFVNEVSALTYEPVAKADVDLFETLYIPAFEQIFRILDIENFQHWAYPCAIGGNTVLSADIYDNLGKIPNYILSRPKHNEFASWDSLMRNLGELVDDFETVFSQHAEKIGDDRYVVERFYKRLNPNPNYEEDLAAYNEHVMLVSDMLFELARLCNLILTRIREIYPDYKKELGILHIDNRLSEPDLLYRESELSDAPYPGLKEYIRVRLTREKHLGSKANIDESGYER